MRTDRDEPETRRELDALTAAFFRAVSFEEGGMPAYASLHSLFLDGGLLIRNSGSRPEIATVAQFIEPRQAMVDSAELVRFREAETADITEVFGNVAHRLSTYEKTGRSGGADIRGRGVISTQFVMTPDGWRISSMAWDDERPGLTIPERYR